MSKDFRVVASAFENLKLRKLSKQLGDEGVLSLISLWAYAAAHKPSGILGACAAEDIEMMAAWEVASREGEFAKVVADLRLIDHDDAAGYAIHDWPEHNSFLVTGSGKVRSSVVDVRVDTGIMSHRKIVALRRSLGAAGVVSLMRLWAFAAVYRTDGVLDGMSYRDVSAESRWPSDDAAYVSLLVDLHLLESEGLEDPNEPERDPTLGGPFLIHDWSDWNPWRTGSKERSKRGKIASHKRWSEAHTPSTPIADTRNQPPHFPPPPPPAPPPAPSPLVPKPATSPSAAEGATSIAERRRENYDGGTVLSGTLGRKFS